MSLLPWGGQASWPRGAHSTLGRGPERRLHLLPPRSPAPAAGHSSRSLPETRLQPGQQRGGGNTPHQPSVASCSNEGFPAAPLRAADASDET